MRSYRGPRPLLTILRHVRRVFGDHDPRALEAFLSLFWAWWACGFLLPDVFHSSLAYRLFLDSGLPAPLWWVLMEIGAGTALWCQARWDRRGRTGVQVVEFGVWMMMGTMFGMGVSWHTPGWIYFAGLAAGNFAIFLYLLSHLMAGPREH